MSEIIPITTHSLLPTPCIVGVDTGGTFTDIVIRGANGSLTVRKLPSTPHDPSQSVLEGIADAQREGLITGPFQVAHGTTVATNALLQKRGARTALITTQGFRDVLEIGRQTRTHLYALHPTKPAPLIDRASRFELSERLDWQGNILVSLEESRVSALLDDLKARGYESLAVCFLFAYLNPVHERLVERLARERGLAVSVSCDVAPEPREYERTSTTAANAFVAPIMARYLHHLETQLKTMGCLHLRVMQSDGGALSPGEAARRAISTALSGPAGGIVAAVKVGTEAGFPDLLTFDMGGTSTDVALIHGGQCAVVTNGNLGDFPLRAPMLDIHTVGAGGGSLARIDRAGSLRVGPQSAGADPGPVAYGRGDTLTVTDANVLLGRLPEDLRLAGRLSLDGDRVRAHFDQFAAQLRCSPEQAAIGILEVANATMARALRHVSVERGHDPAGLTLLSFGGAGGLHACALARALGMTRILIPRYPGAFSALGLALANVRREYAQAIPPLRLDPAGLESAIRLLKPIETQLRERAHEEGEQQGVAGEAWQAQMLLDMRYVGQSFELRVPLPGDSPALLNHSPILTNALAAFHALHLQRFGYADTREPVQITTIRLIATGIAPSPETSSASTPGLMATSNSQKNSEQSQLSAPSKTIKEFYLRRVYMEHDWQDIPLCTREALLPGQTLVGPTLVVQEDAATYIAPGWEAQTDASCNLLLTFRPNP